MNVTRFGGEGCGICVPIQRFLKSWGRKTKERFTGDCYLETATSLEQCKNGECQFSGPNCGTVACGCCKIACVCPYNLNDME